MKATQCVPLAAALWLTATLQAAAAQPASGGDPREDDLIEEVVVTGELRQSALADSAASISVLSLEDQRSGTVNHLEEVLGWVPNVNFASGGARARFVQIRGIGERGQFAEPLNPSVGMVLDGVDLTGLGVAATLFDVEQVEVLRGPQGTLYGANALAGLINIRTRDPSDRFESKLRLDAGDHDSVGAAAVVSGPLSKTLGYRLSVQQYQDDGFMKNRHLDRDDTNEHDELTVRGKLRWEPTEDQTWTFSAGLVDADNGYDAFSLDNDRHTLSDEPGHDRQETGYGSASVQWHVNQAVSLSGTLGASTSDMDYGYDEDWTYVGFHPDGYASTDRYLRSRDGASLDLRLLSGPAGRLFDDSTDWIVGVYALEQTEDTTRRYTFFDGDFESDYRVRRLAVYGELEHELNARTRLIAGLRAERHSAEYDNSDGVRFDPEDRMYGGRVVLERDLGAAVMAYLSATRGYKVGGFNISGSLDPALREYDPETLWNYELGLKGSWLEDRLNLRAALFTMRRDDVQVDTSIIVEREGNAVEFIDLVDNAARGRNAGLELELDYRPVERLRLFANLGLMDTRFEDFVNNSGEDMDGEPQAHAPAYQFFVGAELVPAPGWFVRVEIEGRDDFYFSTSNRFTYRDGDVLLPVDPDDTRSEPFELYHASVGYEASRWSLKLWTRNLTDEDHAVRGYYFPNDPRTGYQPQGWVQLGEPRRYGLTFTVTN